MELEDKDLSFNYRTHCDPRLNYEQSLGGLNSLEIGSKCLSAGPCFRCQLDVAFLLADYLKSKRRGERPHDILLSSLRGRTN